MSPISKAVDTPQVVVTGQWLFDNFVSTGNSAEQQTRMNQVRILVKSASFDDIKKGFKDAIEIAHKHDMAAGIPEKERGPKRHSAMNARTVMQNSFGALRLAMPELVKLGYTEDTGYGAMATIAQRALKEKGLKWNGTPLPTDESKAREAMKRENEEKNASIAQAMAETPRGEDEAMMDWLARVAAKGDSILLETKIEAQKRVASKVVVDLIAKHGRDVAGIILDRLQTILNETAEMTDEQVDAVLKQAGEEEASQEAEAEENAEA